MGPASAASLCHGAVRGRARNLHTLRGAMRIDPVTAAAGIGGALAMSFATGAGRRAGLDVDLETLAGTQLGLPPGPRAWWAGLLSQCAVGSLLFAQGYRVAFEQLQLRPTPLRGAVLGLLHGAAAGAALAAAPLVHPQMPDTIPPPGPFMLHRGAGAAMLFVGVHALFGAIVATAVDARAAHLHASHARLRT